VVVELPVRVLTAQESSSWGILALIAEFENDIRREKRMDGIAKAQERGVKFGRKPRLVAETIERVRGLR
jgi:DNA invertase Pin-like site-specific DNA recombinase